MKKSTISILLGLVVVAGAQADTPLTIDPGTPYGCLQNAYLFPSPLLVSNNFTVSGVSGAGAVQSSVPASAPLWYGGLTAYFYNYTLDLSRLAPTTNHCIKLLVHFGPPQGCDADEVWGSPSQIQSASLAPFGDITFLFAGGCLSPGQPSVTFTMFSEAAPKTNIVTVIDDYFDPLRNLTNETRFNVAAIVPDIPPDPPPWYFVSPVRIPYAWFQGLINSNNPAPPFTNGFVSGPYDFRLQLLSAPSNGLAVSQMSTQTVQVAGGLFNLPLPYDPASMGDGSVRWLSIGVRPSNVPAVQFTSIGPPLPLAATPQAFYAYSAGTVADLAPGQAVTSVNGLTDAVNLLAGNGIFLDTNGNTLIISAAVGSDKNLKTDFAVVKPEDVLTRLAALPIQGWRYTNELPSTRHLGPMAQDFKAAFGLGRNDKIIEIVDEQGVALAAIQALNQKVEAGSRRSDVESQQSESRIRKLETENADLRARLEKLERLINSINGGDHENYHLNEE